MSAMDSLFRGVRRSRSDLAGDAGFSALAGSCCGAPEALPLGDVWATRPSKERLVLAASPIICARDGFLGEVGWAGVDWEAAEGGRWAEGEEVGGQGAS